MATGNNESKRGEFSSACESEARRRRVIGVHVIFRHGARTPVYSIPDPRKLMQETHWDSPAMTATLQESLIPVSVCLLSGEPDAELHEESGVDGKKEKAAAGEMTHRGQQDMLRLGQRLRQRYIADLGVVAPRFDPSEVYCRSTRVSRTLVSMRCVVAGMFSRESLLQNGDIVKLHVSKPEEEILMPNRQLCPFLSKNHTLGNLPEPISRMQEKIGKLFGEEGLVVDLPTKDGTTRRVDLPRVCAYDTLVTRQHHGETLPPQFEEFLEELITLMPVDFSTSVLGSEETRNSIGYRAAIGPLCHQILSNLQQQREKRTQRLILFGTHDEPLTYLLMALGLFDQRWPTYGADLALELLETEEGGLLVRALYCGELVEEMSFEEMEGRLRKIATTAEEYQEICRL